MLYARIDTVRAGIVASLLCLIALAAWTTYLIQKYSVAIPFQDDWNFARIYLRWKSGELTFAELYRPFNEHRLAVPLALMLATAAITDWQIPYTLLLSVVIASGSGLLLLYLIFRTVSDDPIVASVTSVAILVALFNLAQYVNWVWEWDLCWFVVQFFVIACMVCLYCAATGRESFVYLAAASATLASFSFGHGLLVWPAGLAYFLCEIRLRKFALAWLGVAAFTGANYFRGYHRAGLAMSGMSLVERAVGTIDFVFRFLGSAVSSGYVGGAALIALVCVGTFYIAKRRQAQALPWLCMMLVVAGGALAAAISRVPIFGGIEGSQTRYSTASGLFAACACAVLVIASSKMRPAIRIAIPIAIILFTGYRNVEGYHWLRWLSDRLRTDQACLYKDLGNTKCLEDVFTVGGADEVRNVWRQLQSIGWTEQVRPSSLAP